VKRVARSAIVEHAAGEVFALIEDIEAYPQFLPWCLEAKVLERSARRTVARLTVGFRGLRQSFTTENRARSGEAIEMRLVEGPFRSFAGSWHFAALAPDACRIEFRLEYQFASRVLAKALEPMFDHIANTMVDAFSRRAAARHGHARH
jgi:ribosome-associated toxin RatA of RatAB toxin-antitoxin module